MRFKIDWASLIVGSKCTVLALFYFAFEGNFPSTSPQGAYIWRGDLTKGFFALPVWEAYIWRGLFSEFYCILRPWVLVRPWLEPAISPVPSHPTELTGRRLVFR